MEKRLIAIALSSWLILTGGDKALVLSRFVSGKLMVKSVRQVQSTLFFRDDFTRE